MKRFIVAALAGAIGLSAASASAQTATSSRDCEAIRARAAGDAALLLSPSMQVQGIKYPATGTFGAIGGSTTELGLQARLAFLWSPLDAYKSTLVRELADKDCAQQTAMVEAQQALEWLNDIGKEGALKAQMGLLDDHHEDINNLLSKANERLAIGNITLVELNVLQQAASALELKRVQALGQLSVLHAKGLVPKTHSFDELIARVESSSMVWERQFSAVNRLQPWKFDINAGVIPPMTQGDSVDWFGLVSLTYNFGDLAQKSSEHRYLDARQHELLYARYELADQLRRFKQTIVANINALTMDQGVLQQHLADLSKTRAALHAHPDAPQAANAEALVQLQIWDTESDLLANDGMLKELQTFYFGDK